MDDIQRLHLQKMIKANNTEDYTESIREMKHSGLIRDQVNSMILLKAKYRDDPEQFNLECMNDCNFLFTCYTDIYNKIKKDEIDLNILFKFLDVLKKIEDGELDQHEASFLVGTILKELYIDSALKKSEKLDEKYGNTKEKEEQKKPNINISYKKWKKNNL
jgi:hypothetical protein